MRVRGCAAAEDSALVGLRGRQGRQLGTDLLELVFSKLSAKDLAAAELTCCQWKAVIRQRELWRLHCLTARESVATVRRSGEAVEMHNPHTPEVFEPPPGNSADGRGWRRDFLHAAAARRWLGPGPAVRLVGTDISEGYASSMAASGSTLACATGQVVRLYDVDRGDWRREVQAGDTVSTLAMAAPHLLLAGAGVRVRLWRKGTHVRDFTGALSSVAFVGEAEGVVASATLKDSAVQLHDMYSGALSAIVRPHSSDARLTAAHLSGNGALVSAASSEGSDGTLALTNAATGLNALRFKTTVPGRKRGARWVHHTPEHNRLLCSWFGGATAVYDTRAASEPVSWVDTDCALQSFYHRCVPPWGSDVLFDICPCRDLLLEVRDAASNMRLATRGEELPPSRLPDFRDDKDRHGLSLKHLSSPPQITCAVAVAGRLAVGTAAGVTLWRLPGYETLIV